MNNEVNINQDYNESVLIVDDNPKNLQILGTILQKEGLNVEFSIDGVSALDWLSKKPFSLVLLDIMMPGIDGYVVCEKMKNNPNTADIPVIFITAKTDADSIVKGFETGAVDYISKPFIPDELLARVRSQIKIQNSKKKIIDFSKALENKNKNISSSIEYARNIQKAILHSPISKTVINPDYFILNIPKDIVSGDFYWFHSAGDLLLAAVMDCTGHGVPGAFMSILGMTILNEIVLHDGIVSPEKILGNLRDRIIESLGQKYEKTRIKDGMEGAIISYDQNKRELLYAGAFNPLIYIHEEELKVIKADRIPAGYYDKIGNFTLHKLNVAPNDIIYMYSDGFIDQFGGPEVKKIKSENFRKQLFTNRGLPMHEQRSALIDYLHRWMNGIDQTDDILVVGMKF